MLTKEAIYGIQGTDQPGERYADSHAYRIYRLPADWHLYGKAAGPLGCVTKNRSNLNPKRVPQMPIGT